ncbi:MAG: hypothetical protein RLY20_32 [Verrucomicrobiota bacterium]|jgi:hypothetical protein
MAEFKFACPHCQQHIAATEAYCGLQIQCPSCNGNLIVPGTPAAPAPAPSAPPPVPAPQPGGMRIARPSEPAAPPAQTGPACPSCRTPMPRGAVLCTSCGYNTVTRQRVRTGSAAAAIASSGEAKWYQTPWPYIGLTVVLIGLFYALGKVNPAFYLGIAGTLGIYFLVVEILMLISAFKEGVGTGLLCLCIPIYALYYVFKVSENDTLKILYGFNVIIWIALKFIGAFLG